MTTPTNPEPENKMDPTPETENQVVQLCHPITGFRLPCVGVDFARKLERERNELREQLEHALNPIHTCGEQCQRPACVMRRERDQLLAKTQRLEKEIQELKGKI